MNRFFWAFLLLIKMDFPAGFRAKSIGSPMGKLIKKDYTERKQRAQFKNYV
jgi:hypothetical protein